MSFTQPALFPSVPDDLAMQRRLCRARWWWLGAVVLLVPGAQWGLQLPLPLLPVLGILLTVALINLASAWRLRKAQSSRPAALFLQLCIDLAALSGLMFLSGGATNPLISLLLPLVAAAALSLSRVYASAYTALAILAYSALMQFYLPLALSDPLRATRLHLLGMWLTFVISAGLIGWLVLRMTGQIRQRDAALAEAREHALREERVMALGALAAGAAHELGTPLATMALIAEELTQEAGLGPVAREDVDTLRQQIATCKSVLTNLAARAGAERGENLRREALDHWLQDMRVRWQALRPGANFALSTPSSQAPEILVEPSLDQALLNLLNNAARAAVSAVQLVADWNAQRWSLEIRDDGPGFPPEVLDRGGRDAFPAHASGNGIGLMLSAASVQRLGGSLRFFNPAEGGACARLEFPRHD